jgi:hypothetical protein
MATIAKRKNLSAGVRHSSPEARMVDPKGAFTQVQKRTLASKGAKAGSKALRSKKRATPSARKGMKVGKCKNGC